MNRYSPSAFHPVLGLAAIAMTALTFVFAVGVPLHIAADAAQTVAGAASQPVEVAIIPARIDVVGTRETTLADHHAKQRG